MSVSSMHDLSRTLTTQSLKDLSQTRAGTASFEVCDWHFDMSRHYLNPAAEAALLELAKAKRIDEAIANLFNHNIVNRSENRPALHWALRAQTAQTGEAEIVRSSTEAALEKAADITSGRRTTHNGNSFNAIVHIGIGGSDFGPRLIADAFSDHTYPDVEMRFCANLDPLDLEMALAGLDPNRTLIVGISKSFGTEETLYNLARARGWLKASLGADWGQHLVLVTANIPRANSWVKSDSGASPGDVLCLHLPESVGGRFSIWSAGSFSCMIGLNASVFKQFLEGAADMDAHVRDSDIRANIALRLALIDVWNTSYMGFGARAVLAYSRRLRRLPDYLQQLEMESNGKSVSPDGVTVSELTAPLLWGGEGSNGQHSYHQWLHQGTHIVPTEFILAPGCLSDPAGVTGLQAHALAQSEVLANGRSLQEVMDEEPDLAPEIAAQKVHPGGRPSSLLITKQLTPRALGNLISLYEHRTYLAGYLWGINSFDQWGVERGKTIAGRIRTAIIANTATDDPVTSQLVSKIKA